MTESARDSSPYSETRYRAAVSRQALLRARFQLMARGAGAVAALLGALALSGWIFGIPILTSTVPGFTAMKVTTALSFIFCGGALLLQVDSGADRRRDLGRLCAVSVTLIALLTLAEYSFDFDAGIEQLLLRDFGGELQAKHPGRMAPMTAVSLALLGTALFFFDSPHQRHGRVTTVSALFGLLIGFLALTGYVLNAHVLFGVAGYRSMALPTAVGIVLLALGSILGRPERGVAAVLAEHSPSGAAIRRLLPLVFVLPLTVAWFRLQGQYAGLYGTEFGLALMVTVCTSIIGALALWNAHVQSRSQRLHEDAARDERFLFELSEALRVSSAGPESIFQISEMLAKYLNLSRCALIEVDVAKHEVVIRQDYHRDLPSIAGRRPLTAYNTEAWAEARAGRTIISNDTQSDPRTAAHYERDYGPAGIRARVAVPLLRNGTWASLFFVSSHEPRHWASREVQLVQSVAERAWLWLERLSALEDLRKRELDLAVTMKSIGDAVITTDDNGCVLLMNPIAEQLTGWPLSEAKGKPLDEVFRVVDEETRAVIESPAASVLRERKVIGLANHAVLVPRAAVERPISDSAAPILNLEGSLQGVVLVFRDATASREAERALAASEEKYRDLYENAPDMYVSVNADTKQIVDCNRAVLNTLGYTRDELVGKPVLELYDQSCAADAREAIKRLRQVGELRDLEFILCAKDGARIDVSLNVSALRNAAGEIVSSRSVWRDITARKRLERELALMAKVTDLFRSSGEPGERGEILRRVSQALAEHIGASRALFADIDVAHNLVSIEGDYHRQDLPSLSGTLPLSEYATPEALVEFQAARTMVNQDTSRDPLTISRKESYAAIGISSVISVPLLRDSQWAATLVVCASEVRAWKDYEVAFIERLAERTWLWVEHLRMSAARRALEAEEAARASNERFRAIVESVEYAIVMLDRNGMIISWNPGAQQIYGYTPEEILGRHFSRLHPEQERDAGGTATLLDDAIAVGQFELEGPRRRKDGTTFWASVLMTVLRDADRQPARFVKITRDFSERRAAAEELKRNAERLEASLKEREILLQEVHHRVKNNLQVIASLINMQIRQVADRAARGALDECQSRVQAIALIHEKLYQSKDYSRVPFSEYAKSLAGTIFHATGVSPTAISLELDFEALSLAVDKAIPCGLILNELITNALKHGFPEGRAGRIHVDLRKSEAQCLVLSVSDDGIGLPADFDIEQSTSLGMQLVSTLVEQLNGHLAIRRHEGTTFIVTFPTE
ncbi:MAG TPA: PAS domain S-box protein [Polyangiaceae bacterium]|nr:PAS domain S-box protein [Polyangiaceae bacterium]